MNDVKAQKQWNKCLIDEYDKLIEGFIEKDKELEEAKSFAEQKCKIEEENNRIIRELKGKIIRMNNAERKRETNRKARHK